MKTIIKEKIVEIIIGLVVSVVIVLTGFYYTTQSDINYLQEKTKTNCIDIDKLQERMAEKDIQYREIIIRQDYTIQMLEEIKKGIK